MRILRLLLFTVLTATTIFSSQQANASHALGADISYNCIGPNTYSVVVSFYRDCDGINAPTDLTLEYFSSSCGVGPLNITLTQGLTCTNAIGQCCGNELPGVCGAQLPNTTCNGGSQFPGVEVYTYCGTITLPANCPDWIISYGECCRNSAITNLASASSNDGYVEAVINNTSGICNNSPFFTTTPSQLFCDGFSYCYNNGTVDLDGDSLVFSLVNPLDDNLVPIAYNPGFSPSQPMATIGPFQFDSTTGQMCFTPDGAQAAVVTLLVEEYRTIGGVPTLIGNTMRDIQFQVLDGSICSGSQPSPAVPTNVTGGGFLDSTSLQMCPGTTITFDVISIDDAGNLLNMVSNDVASIPGAVWTTSGQNTDTVTGTFTWTPTPAQAGPWFFSVNVTNNACPVPGSNTQTILINVFDDVVITSSSPAFCGNPVQLEAIGGTVFNWSPPAGLSNPFVFNPTATPTVPTWYTVTTDCGFDSIFVDIAPPFVLDAGPDTSICLNGLVGLSPTASEPIATWTWRPTTGLSDPNIRNPQAGPGVNTTYIVEAISVDGCINEDTITVSVSGVAPSVSAFSNPDTVCPGGSSQLTLSVAPQFCGPNVSPCNTPGSAYTVGTAATSNSGLTTTYPAIYGHFYESARHQILYTAADITSSGVASGGTISEIAFNIDDINGTTQYCEWTIYIGCVGALGNITSFQTGLTEVYTPKTINIAPGWNNYILDQPYDWDGVSDIVVEICFNSSVCQTTFTSNSNTFYTTTPYTSVVYYRVDGTTACNNTSITNTSNERPNTRFNICQQELTSGALVSWSPPGLVSDPADDDPVARVFGTTTFVVDVDEGGCVGSAFVTVNVDTSVFVTAGPDTSLCSPAPITITADAVGTPSPILLTCGANGTALGGPANPRQVGSGTTLTNITTPFRGSDHEARVQYLFRASELQGGGMSMGVISQLAFDIQGKSSSGAFNDFTIRMGCTNDDELTGFSALPLDVVYTPKAVTTTGGIFTFNLDNTFDWDGFTNIIVEVCYTNTGSIGDDVVNASNTSFNSVTYESQSFAFQGGCNINGFPQLSVTRPDIIFSISTPPPGQFTYQWTPSIGLMDPITGQPTDTGRVVMLNAIDSIEYVVEVTDGSCVAYDTVTIDFYDGYLTNAAGSNVGCSGGSNGNLIAAPSGGVAPYNIDWYDSTNTLIQSSTNITEDTVYNITAGTYYLEVIDNNSCMQLDTIVITVPPPLAVASIAGVDVSCFGYTDGSVAVTATGGTLPYSFIWSNGGITPALDSIAAGMYNVTVTDASGCSVADSVTIIEPGTILYNTTTTDALCAVSADGSATITITSGGSGSFSYLWSNGQTTAAANGLIAGTYFVTATDNAGGCMIFDTAVIMAPDSFNISLQGPTVDASCFNTADGQAGVSVQGDTTNYTFLWPNGQTTAYATQLPQGLNTVVVTDTSGCSQPFDLIIGSPDQLILLVDTSAISCPGGDDGTAEVIVDAGGVAPFTFVWSTGETTAAISNLADGASYSVTVVDANGCDETATVALGSPAPIATVPTIDPALCFGDATGGASVVSTGGTGPYTYDWSNGATGASIDNLSAGSYSVTVTDANGCVDTSLTSVVVTEPGTGIGLTTSLIDESCPEAGDGAVTVFGVGGTPPYGVSFNGGLETFGSTATFNTLNAGTYSVEITDSNGCTTDTTVEVLGPDPFQIGFDTNEVEITIGDSIQLVPEMDPADSAYQFVWQPVIALSCDSCQSPTANPVITQNYVVTATLGNCSESAEVTVTVVNDKKLFVPNAFSPNGDEVNDAFQVFAPGGKSMRLKVFDRWGAKVFEGTDVDLSIVWDGTYKSKILPPDVYVYYVEVTYFDDQVKAKKGSVTIIK